MFFKIGKMYRDFVGDYMIIGTFNDKYGHDRVVILYEDKGKMIVTTITCKALMSAKPKEL